MNGPATAATGRRPHWDLGVGLLTDVGRMRERNEDTYAAYVPYPGDEIRTRVDALFMVADGMGGHEAGNLASRHAADRVREWFTQPAAADAEFDAPREFQAVFRQVNGELIELARERGLGRGVGTTATVVAITGSTLHVGHVGDSRLYRWRDGVLTQVTEDHSWIAEQRRAGLVSAEEAATHPNRNVLTQCLGIGKDPKIFLASDELRDGDRYLLSSDGLHGGVDAVRIAEILGSEGDPQEAVRRLVQHANAVDGSDNITAVAFHVRVAASQVVTQPGTVGLPLDITGPVGNGSGSGDPVAAGGPTRRVAAWARRLRGSHALLGLGTLVLLATLVTALVWQPDTNGGPAESGDAIDNGTEVNEPTDPVPAPDTGSGPEEPRDDPPGPDADAPRRDDR